MNGQNCLEMAQVHSANQHFLDRAISKPNNVSMMPLPSVCAIVLNWNERDFTLACLASLMDQTYSAVRMVMVDNGSADGSIEAIRVKFPTIEIIDNKRNLGYSGGNNAALVQCMSNGRDEFFLMLNNDTVVDRDFVAQLVAAAVSHPSGGAFGPKVMRMNAESIVSFAGGHWDARWATCVHDGEGEGEQEASMSEDIRPTEYLTGCALFVRRSVLEKVGAFDDRFFLYYEDVELSYRIRRAGMGCFFVPLARVRHAVSASIGKSSLLSTYFLSRNRLLFAQKQLGIRVFFRLLANVLIDIAIPPLARNISYDQNPFKRLYLIFRKEGTKAFTGYRDVRYRVSACGVRDFVFRRFGDCPRKLRETLRLAESAL